ncbi:glycosyltransferase [Fibrella aquatilis]|uniref:Glycosyltransferase family 4 protein n=1 Tax=Fibrella aquatilis TaxID=2817059 RepID=A0A939GBI7_9BACT|nr:glycosyltransferase [Fibrella aquatilis]MBO0933587.1 glycosyltransferase family 4 protein [Fibrella aquatilis]
MTAKVALLTDVHFWEQHSGRQTRTNSMMKYLSNHIELVILYAGVEQFDEDSWEGNYDHLTVIHLSPDEKLTHAEYAKLGQNYLQNNKIDVCIIDNLAATFLIDYLPNDVSVILDTIDLVSDLNKSYAQFNILCGLQGEEINTINLEEEIHLFKRYNYVLLIQKFDYQKIQPALGQKALLVPHPVDFPQQTIRQQGLHVGYVAFGTKPNLDAIVWFLNEVWPSVYVDGLYLHLFGDICNMLRFNNYSDIHQEWLRNQEKYSPGITQFYQSRSLDIEAQPGVILHDYLPNRDQIYTQVDVVINPVRFGAGLKIKNVEALGYGLPLLTTTHGACGLETHVGEALLVADQPADFAQQLSRLLAGYPLRKAVGQAAYQLARSEFSPDACFGPLLAAIQTLQRA